MNNCCLKSVPQSDSSFETFARPVADWQARLTAGLTRSLEASDQNLGHKGVSPEWRLVKAQNFLGEAFASLGIWECAEDHLAA